MVGCWHSYLSGARCRLAYGPADATHCLKSRLLLPFSYRLTWVVPDRGPLNGCVYVCILGMLVRNTVMWTTFSLRTRCWLSDSWITGARPATNASAFCLVATSIIRMCRWVSRLSSQPSMNQSRSANIINRR